LVVENVVGAGGSIGIGRAVRADPDGYTLVLGNWNTHVSAGAIYRVRYDVLKDLEPIARLPVSRLWLVGSKALPARDAVELIVWLKAASSGATAAIVGAGSAAHLCAIDIEKKTGAHLRLVSYHGGPSAYHDLVGGHIDLMCAEVSATLPYVREGKLKAYAVFAKERWPLVPDIPSLNEVGVPGPYMAFWHGLWAPRGTPADIVDKLNAAVDDALRDPVVGARIAALGQELPSPEERTPEALGRYHKAEVERWWPIIKEVGIKAD
jgi:tripartite-type tricarboxylate transporter receptor subunit TctC